MDRRCEVCGSENICLKYSRSSAIWGDHYICSSTCSSVSNRFYNLFAGFVSYLLVIFTMKFLILELFLIPMTLYLYYSAYKGFIYAKEFENQPSNGSSDKFTTRLKSLNRKLETRENKTQEVLVKINSTPTPGDIDPQGFFILVNGKLKEN